MSKQKAGTMLRCAVALFGALLSIGAYAYQSEPKSNNSSPVQKQLAVNAATSSQAVPAKHTDTERDPTTKQLVDGTWALALFTLILGGASIWQVVETRRNAKRESRAYVFIKKIKWEQVPGGPGMTDNIRFIPIWENSGNTPTRHLLCRTNIDTFDQMPIPTSNFPDSAPIDNAGLIGPKMRFEGPVVFLPLPMIEHISHARKYAYIWGWVEYDDVFNGTPRHRTEFCYQITVSRVPIFPESVRYLIKFTTHDEYNAADEDCSRRKMV